MEQPNDKTSRIPLDPFFAYILFDIETNTPRLHHSINAFDLRLVEWSTVRTTGRNCQLAQEYERLHYERANRKRDIFLNRVDRNAFISRLSKLAQDGSVAVYARSLLLNHFHLLCKAKERPLSSGMRKLWTG